MKHRTNIVRRGVAFAALAAGSVITFACADSSRPAAPGTAHTAPFGIAKNIVDPPDPRGSISGTSSVYPQSSSATSQTVTLSPASTIGLNGSFTISSNLGSAVSQSLACNLASTSLCPASGFAAGGASCDGVTSSISGSVQASHHAIWASAEASTFSQSANSYTCPPPPAPPAPIASSGGDWQDVCAYYDDGTSECFNGWDDPPLGRPAGSGYNVLASRASPSHADAVPGDNDVTVVATGPVAGAAPATILRRPDIAPHDVVVIDTTRAHPEDLAGALLAIASLRVLEGSISPRVLQASVSAEYLGTAWHHGTRASTLEKLLALRSAPERLVNGLGRVHAADLPAIPHGVTQRRHP